MNRALLRNMQPADDDGFRFVVGRKFVDVKDVGTVHVEFDADLGAYRVTDLYKKLPPGPALYKNAGEATWSPTHQVGAHPPLKRLHSADDEIAAPVKQPAASRPAIQTEAAIPPLPPAGFHGAPTHLSAWTDHQIRQFYGLHDQDILRFRIEAQTSGTRPEWARPLNSGNPRDELLGDSLRWLYPTMTHGERVVLLRSYNLSPNQHRQLRNDLIDNPRALPQWVEQHRLRTLDANAPTRFDPFHQEIEPLLLPLRNGTSQLRGLFDLDETVSREFLDAFLAKLGYLRNGNDCLYRTDIPGLFRADERTPFEFYNDARMLPRLKHPRGATTEKPISATVSLKLVKEYAGRGTDAPDPEYLRYNNQKNKYPGKKPGEPDNDSDSSDNDWSDSSEVELDSERNYETIRHKQNFIFAYVIDTRKMEVVLREENIFLNGSAEKQGAWFPEDDHEALISTSKRGIGSERIWLLDSTLTRAAKINDVAQQADYYSRMDIEEQTHSGAYNRHRYDALIEAVAQAGKPILKLDSGKQWFANDIVWPE
ncbi:hypothetical protein [Pseudomonas frederiksbergensis]|uniref:hypothetical protein n=1 Tax=Pseudomonas frederiksbergensis TaxID=104087 RepID=UPI001F11B8D1|nr:hypothetical protein [Pseudomonas frederiksbergensis]